MPRPTIIRDDSYFARPNFPHGKNAGYARRCRCVDCKKAHAAEVQANWLKNHPEPRGAYRKHGRETGHPDFPHGEFAGYRAGCRCAACVESRRVHAARYDVLHRRVGGAGFAKKVAANAVWRKSHKGLIAARKGNAARAARKRGAIVGLEPSDQRLLTCIYASCPQGYEVDHIIALVNGGAHAPSNLQYLPMTVNRQKSGRANYESAQYAIPWQDLLEVPSTIIPQGSRAKRLEARQVPEGIMI